MDLDIRWWTLKLAKLLILGNKKAVNGRLWKW